MREDESLYCVSVADVQARALDVLERELTDDELHRVSKGLNWALCEGFDIILDTAIEEATKPEEV